LTDEEYNNLDIHVKSGNRPKAENKRPIRHNSDDEMKGKRSLLDRVFGRNKKQDVLS
jgi:hypothetical protein